MKYLGLLEKAEASLRNVPEILERCKTPAQHSRNSGDPLNPRASFLRFWSPVNPRLSVPKISESCKTPAQHRKHR